MVGAGGSGSDEFVIPERCHTLRKSRAQPHCVWIPACSSPLKREPDMKLISKNKERYSLWESVQVCRIVASSDPILADNIIFVTDVIQCAYLIYEWVRWKNKLALNDSPATSL